MTENCNNEKLTLKPAEAAILLNYGGLKHGKRKKAGCDDIL